MKRLLLFTLIILSVNLAFSYGQLIETKEITIDTKLFESLSSMDTSNAYIIEGLIGLNNMYMGNSNTAGANIGDFKLILERCSYFRVNDVTKLTNNN